MNDEKIVILHNDGFGNLTINVRDYKGELNELRDACDCDTIMIYNTSRMCLWLPMELFVVCDDNGKVFHKSPTMPIYDYRGEMVDFFVGDIAFIKPDPFCGAEDRGLNDEEVDRLISELQKFYKQFKMPRIKYINWH